MSEQSIVLKNRKLTLLAEEAAAFALPWVAEDDFGVSEVDFEAEPLRPPRATKVELPVIPLRDMIIYPRMVTQFFVGFIY